MCEGGPPAPETSRLAVAVACLFPIGSQAAPRVAPGRRAGPVILVVMPSPAFLLSCVAIFRRCWSRRAALHGAHVGRRSTPAMQHHRPGSTRRPGRGRRATTCHLARSWPTQQPRHRITQDGVDLGDQLAQLWVLVQQERGGRDCETLGDRAGRRRRPGAAVRCDRLPFCQHRTGRSTR